VRLLIQGNSDQWWTDWATQALVEELAREEIEIYFYQPSFLHAKVAVIDDALTVGSSNIDPFSLMFSLEANLVADDALVAGQLRALLEEAMADSVTKNEKLYRSRGPLRALGRRLALTGALMLLRGFLAFGKAPFR
jgi:phosphatidylserine/phosphatidylglycerophosphate/cardiolipin synthase-like enzyme